MSAAFDGLDILRCATTSQFVIPLDCARWLVPATRSRREIAGLRVSKCSNLLKHAVSRLTGWVEHCGPLLSRSTESAKIVEPMVESPCSTRANQQPIVEHLRITVLLERDRQASNPVALVEVPDRLDDRWSSDDRVYEPSSR